MRLFLVIAALAALASCQSPVSPSHAGFSLAVRVAYTQAHLPTTATAARLLLPTAGFARLTLTNAGGTVTTSSQVLGTSGASVFQLTGVEYGTYTLKGEAFSDASAQTPLFANSTTLTLTAATASVQLNLLPASATTISVGATSGSLAPASSQSFVYVMKSASNALTLSSLPAGVSYYLQRSDGSTVSDSGGSIAAGATDGTLMLTLYNPGSSAVPYAFALAETPSGGVSLPANLGVAQWAATTTSASDNSGFSGVAVDPSGSVLAAGFMSNTYAFAFAGASVTGLSLQKNPLLVKLSPKGTVLWTLTSTAIAASSSTVFSGVASDASGNAYVAGSMTMAGTYQFGSSVGVSPVTSGAGLLVKVDSSGHPLWAVSTTNGGGDNAFNAVAVDSAGRSWAVGYSQTSKPLGFSTGPTLTTDGNGDLLIVNFDASGNTQWISGSAGSQSGSTYKAVAVDSADNAYAAGFIEGSSSYTVGSSLLVTGTGANENALLVKYNSSGVPVWAATPLKGGLATTYNAVAVDPSGNVYAVGYLDGGGTLDFGGGQSLTGATASGVLSAVIVKYDASGNTLWARTLPVAAGASQFNAVSVDSAGTVYVAGLVTGIGTFSFGTQTVTTTNKGTNLVLVRYDAAGNDVWARTQASGGSSQYNGVAADGTGAVFTAGLAIGGAASDLGNLITVTGASSGATDAFVAEYH